jgi:hypothetical protein
MSKQLSLILALTIAAAALTTVPATARECPKYTTECKIGGSDRGEFDRGGLIPLTNDVFSAKCADTPGCGN